VRVNKYQSSPLSAHSRPSFWCCSRHRWTRQLSRIVPEVWICAIPHVACLPTSAACEFDPSPRTGRASAWCRRGAGGDRALESQSSRISGSISWSIIHRTRPRGLECLAHVRVAVRTAPLVLATEVEPSDLRVADRPTAVVGEKRIYRLSLTKPNFRLVCRQGPRWAFNLMHKSS
jgi:hypothetical protein